jgi:hypothetical protein
MRISRTDAITSEAPSRSSSAMARTPRGPARYDLLAPVTHGRGPQDGSNSMARVHVIRFNLSPSDPIT